MSDPIVALMAWTCDVDDVNGCHSFSSEEAAKPGYDHVCGDQKWRRRSSDRRFRPAAHNNSRGLSGARFGRHVY